MDTTKIFTPVFSYAESRQYTAEMYRNEDKIYEKLEHLLQKNQFPIGNANYFLSAVMPLVENWQWTNLSVRQRCDMETNTHAAKMLFKSIALIAGHIMCREGEKAALEYFNERASLYMETIPQTEKTTQRADIYALVKDAFANCLKHNSSTNPVVAMTRKPQPDQGIKPLTDETEYEQDPLPTAQSNEKGSLQENPSTSEEEPEAPLTSEMEEVSNEEYTSYYRAGMYEAAAMASSMVSSAVFGAVSYIPSFGASASEAAPAALNVEDFEEMVLSDDL